MSTPNEEYLMIAILKGLMQDKQYAIMVSTVFEDKFFDDPAMSEIFAYIKKHISEFNELPDKDIVINGIPKDVRDGAISLYKEAEATDFSISRNYDWLLEHTNRYLKDKAIKSAILKGIDIIDSGDDTSKIRAIVEDALCKDLKVDIGLDYFGMLSERLKKIFTSTEKRVRTYYPTFDELFNGGYPSYTLNLFIAKIHGHKSNIMTNIIARQVMNNVNVGLATLEMSESMYAQRFDANFTSLDINRIYINSKIKKEFIQRIKDIKHSDNLGNLMIKEYPTGKATVNDYRIWLRELSMRDKKPDIFYCDYISLMKPESKKTGDLYKDGKSISEELRALGSEFDIPVVTVAQINRTGTFLDFDALDMNSIGESFSIPAAADTIIVQGYDEDDMVYKNELKWKCVKNRLGGMVGITGKLYYDSKSLRIYDETELDKWMEDAKITNDDRDIFEREDI